MIEYYANVNYLIMMLLVFIVIRAISHQIILLASIQGLTMVVSRCETIGIPLSSTLYCANAQVI